jgi:uncharacterized LabA/DUF88 family protein
MKRVVAYIDGYNLYYGLRSKGWKKYYWLNIQNLANQFLRSRQTLTATKYFTTIIKYPDDKRRRQQVFLEAQKTLPDFYIFYGHFLSDTITCRKCGHTYTTYHEKMTDVNIAVELMQDAFKDQFDVAFLISADSDLVGPISAVQRSFPGKKVISIFPPKRSSYALKQVSNGVLHVGRNELARSLFPDQVIKDGVTLQRPARWH